MSEINPVMQKVFHTELNRIISMVETALDSYLPGENVFPPSIHSSMRYSLFAGGKRLRPVLALGACQAVGGEESLALPVAGALEMIHTYSLIHDDLPAMDDDDLRRGRPTNHIVYGEALAILAGDGLLTRAFGLLAETGVKSSNGSHYLRIIQEIAHAAGSLGMVGGQVVDMASENAQIDFDTLKYIHEHKTGALITSSLRVGAMAAGCNEDQLQALTRYGSNLGLAFQITDDLLDIEGDPALLGKPVGSDQRNNKATYPSLLGMEGARQAAKEAVNDSVASLEPFGESAWLLKEIAIYLLERKT